MIHHIFDSYKAWLPDDTWFVKLTLLDLESVIELFLRDLIKMKQLYLFYLFCNKELLIIVQPKCLWDHILKLFDNLELRRKSSLFQTGFELSSSIHLLRILFKVIFINWSLTFSWLLLLKDSFNLILSIQIYIYFT